MPRPKKRPAVAAPSIRAALIAHREAKVAELRDAHPEVAQIYDFAPEIARLEREIARLSAGGSVTVRRIELPRELVAQFPGVWALRLDGDTVVPAVLDRVEVNESRYLGTRA